MKHLGGPRRSARLSVLAVTLALIAGAFSIGAGPASAAVPADGTYISCSGTTVAPTAPYYVMVGGAPLLMTLDDMPKPGSTSGTPTAADDVTYHSDCATLFPTPKVPRNGVFVRGYDAHAAKGSTYEIVGGAPITVHGWSHVLASGSGKVIPVDHDVLPAATATTDVTRSGTTKLHGYLHARVAAGTAFAGFNTASKTATSFYRVDSVIHPVPQRSASSGEPVVDQTSIEACERMTCDPNGNIVNAYGGGYGVLHVDGWAEDYPSAAPVSVRLSAGTSTFVVAAGQPTTYVPATTAGNHGFAADLPLAAGTYELCGTVLGTAPGATTQPLGCSTVAVPGAKPGTVHRPKARPKGHGKVLVKWKRPSTHGSPISAYIVKTSTGKKKQVSGALHKVVLKHLPRGRHVSVKVRAINAVGLGSYSRTSKSVTVR
ncbi:fibronectin type III domain-containing protein [Nocardioides sp. BP30]|uniref:fibronectin type III domain-containing protein n=1 Tax=Nocardioides sp. BP30 TaxID=3036374 RepID=UPI002469B2F9|nr:fibronectin type III domain-containing protein [Nocardioides sp. BP30]WGL51541.1 fibronectin type III domain-containing protein [Nocardioides sp. BP30]